MHSLRWVCEKVANVTASPTTSEITNAMLGTTLQEPDLKHDDTIEEEPATPIRSPSRQNTGRSGDSGYHTTTSKDWQARFGRDESTPSKPARRATLSSEGGDLCRERHDSLLSPLLGTAEGLRAHSISTASARSRSFSISCASSRSEAVHDQVVYNDDTDECEVLSSSTSAHSGTSSDLSIHGSAIQNAPRVLPPARLSREQIVAQLSLDLPASSASPFYCIPDGIDPPRILQQVPCLQCVLKKLPCDEKLPHCSRCLRSGHGPCLVQRELLAEEKWKVGLWGVEYGKGYTVLVRLGGDDDEAWAIKRRLEECMLDWLAEREGRRNWVFPIDDGVKEGYRRHGYGGEGRRIQSLTLDFVRGRG